MWFELFLFLVIQTIVLGMAYAKGKGDNVAEALKAYKAGGREVAEIFSKQLEEAIARSKRQQELEEAFSVNNRKENDTNG